MWGLRQVGTDISTASFVDKIRCSSECFASAGVERNLSSTEESANLRSVARMSEAKTVDVLVVGAGLSGLRAAVDVHLAGLSVIVLEARDRVGGKTLSVDASTLGGKVDIGAAWINDSNQSEMYKLALEFGFDLVEQRVTGFNLMKGPDGALAKVPHQSSDLESATPEDQAALGALFQSLTEHIAAANAESPHLSPDAQKLDSVSFAEYAKTVSKSEVGARTASAMTAALLGVEADEVSALFMVDYIQSGTGMENMGSDSKHGGQYLRNRQGETIHSDLLSGESLLTLHQGNMSFSTYLAAKLPQGCVQLSTPISRITQTSFNVCEISASSGLVFHAKKVIVSVPTCILPSIVFDPPLPPARKALAESTALGYYAKTIFVFDRPWWREADLSGIMQSEEGPISFSRDTCIEADNQFSITCFIVGESGRQWSKRSAAERRRQVMEQFDGFFGAAARQVGVEVPAPVNLIEKEWIKDPWACGAPSPVMMPGVLTSDSAKAIREPFQNIHFVGTETALVWKGYMEGAVRSGIRGAQEVIHQLATPVQEKAKLS